jgi:hypothetical protein
MDNPLRQYFRRPSIYLKLPSGGEFYPAGAINLPDNKEIPIYPMTAIDEITSKTPDALFNGTAVVEIIKSCAPNILDPWSIPSIDLDAILIAIKSASGGNDMEVTSTCSKCETEGNYSLNLVGLLSNISVGDYSTTVTVTDDLTIKFRPLSYKSVNEINLIQFDLEKKIKAYSTLEDEDLKTKQLAATMKQLSGVSTTLIAETIESISTPNAVVDNTDYIVEFLQNCDAIRYDFIRKEVIKLRESSELKPLKIKCNNCSHEYMQSLVFNVTDFFG